MHLGAFGTEKDVHCQRQCAKALARPTDDLRRSTSSNWFVCRSWCRWSRWRRWGCSCCCSRSGWSSACPSSEPCAAWPCWVGCLLGRHCSLHMIPHFKEFMPVKSIGSPPRHQAAYLRSGGSMRLDGRSRRQPEPAFPRPGAELVSALSWSPHRRGDGGDLPVHHRCRSDSAPDRRISA